MKNKFIRLFMMLSLTLILLTGCKIQSVEEFDKKEKIESEEIVSTDEDFVSEDENEASKEKVTKEDRDKDADKTSKEKDKTKSDSKESPKADTGKKDTSKQEIISKASTSKEKTTPQTPSKLAEKPKAQPDKAQVKPEPKTQVKPEPQPKPQVQTVKKHVTVDIRVDTILKNYDKLDEKLKSEKFVPSSGTILGKTKLELKDGETPLDILAKTGIHMDSQGSGSSAYIRGINNVYEFSCGELSGWMYKVNGTYSNSGVGAYTLKDGDDVSFNYTCNLGRDL